MTTKVTKRSGRFSYGKQTVTFEALDARKIQIDKAYQRFDMVNKSRVKQFVENFDLFSVGALLIGRRTDGSLWCVDGQHRLLAMQILEIPQVPCVVFESKGVADEADMFVRVNRDRSGIRPYGKFRAALAMGHKETIEIDDMCTENGFLISKSKNHRQIAACSMLYLLHERGLLEQTLELISGFDDNPDKRMRRDSCGSAVLGTAAAMILLWGDKVDCERVRTCFARVSIEEWRQMEAVNAGSGLRRGKKIAATFVERFYNVRLAKTKKLRLFRTEELSE